MKIIIPTRGRADVIGDKALRLFTDATLCVGESDVTAYGRLGVVGPSGGSDWCDRGGNGSAVGLFRSTARTQGKEA